MPGFSPIGGTPLGDSGSGLAATYRIECPTQIRVVESYRIECPTAIVVLSALEVAQKRIICPTRFRVVESYRIDCSTQISVTATSYRIDCPTLISVRESYRIDCPTSIVVSAYGTRWKAKLVLNGVDQSARLTGTVTVEAEEGAARIADFTLVPESGPINPFTLSGATVSIDYVSIENGMELPQRLFTGRVDIPEYDAADRVVRFSCTDDLQNHVAALPRSVIDAVTGGRYDPAVQGEIEDNWKYAEARMSTVAGSLDASASGALRVTPWDGLPLWREFELGDILSGTVFTENPRRTYIVNQVTATFEYRFNRLRQRVSNVSFSADMDTVIEEGLPLLAKDTVLAALDATGAIVSNTNFVPYPPFVNLDGASAYSGAWLNNTGDTTVREFSAALTQRWAQTVTETYNITISAPQSIDHNGVIGRDVRGSLSSEWDADAWENARPAAASADGVGRIGSAQPASEPNLTGTAALDYAPDVTPAMRDEAIRTLVDVAKVTILSSHRSARAGATIPLLSSIDLDKCCRIDTPEVQATGKVTRVAHTLDLDAGSALTEFSIALSGHGAVGIVVTTPTTAPPAPAVTETSENDKTALQLHLGGLASSPDYDDTMQGWIINVPRAYNIVDTAGNTYEFNTQTQQEQQADYAGSVINGKYQEVKAYPSQGFRVILPEVPAAERDADTPVIEAGFDVAIPEDEFLQAAA